MNIFVIIVFITFLSSLTVAQNPPYPLQLFYLSPNSVGLSPSAKVAQYNAPSAKTNTKGVPMKKTLDYDDENDDEDDANQSSQFHSQDGEGRAVFGYSTPNQIRIEARNVDGTVRGSYSYLDAWGQIVKIRYWDDGSGFHVVGNNLPGAVSLPDSTQDDPDVEAAKQHHFELFQQALHSSFFPETENKPKPEENYIHETAQDGIVVETDESGTVVTDSGDKLIRYPAVIAPQNLYDPTQIHDSDRDAVIVDNAEVASVRQLSSNSLRSGKNLNLDTLPGTANLKSKPNVAVSNTGFFYSIQHPVPILVQVRTVQDGKTGSDSNSLSLSQKATLFGAVPVAAVHDGQVSPNQRNSIRNHQILPVYVEPQN